jgi:hypothetical protein
MPDASSRSENITQPYSFNIEVRPTAGLPALFAEAHAEDEQQLHCPIIHLSFFGFYAGKGRLRALQLGCKDARMPRKAQK